MSLSFKYPRKTLIPRTRLSWTSWSSNFTCGSPTYTQTLTHTAAKSRRLLDNGQCFITRCKLLLIVNSRCFHRTPKHSQTDDTEHVLVGNSGYRGGTRKGLDLSFGCVPNVTSPYFSQSSKSVPDDKPSLHGGILLRTIRDQSTGRIISGPSLLVDHVLKLSGAGSITELVDEKWGGDIRALHGAKDRTCMYLRRRSSEQTCTIYTSPRIGLDLSHPSAKAAMTNARAQYVAKPYRYFSQPKLLTANGRTQTMLGLWRDVEVRGALLKRSREVMVDELCDVTGMKRKTADGYLTEYMKGVEGKVNLEDFVGREKGKGVSTSATRYLQMIGCIHREESRTT